MNAALTHALENYSSINNELVINNIPISAIVKKAGTPVYIYSEKAILKRHEQIRGDLPKNLAVHYAVKANPDQRVLSIMKDLYDGFDIASIGEMKKAMAAGINPEVMNFAGPGKSMEELSFAIKKGIGGISLESAREMEHVIRICSNGKKVKVWIRVNPEFELKNSGMKMGGGAKQFGIDYRQVQAVLTKIKADKNIMFSGIHVFAGSQNLNADSIISAFENILGMAHELNVVSGAEIGNVNLGAGFGIPYFANDSPLDLKKIGLALDDKLGRFLQQYPNTRFNLELGRFLVGEAGIYICKVLYKKKSQGKTFIITDGGMHHNLAATGNLGQSLVKRPFPITVANNLGEFKEKVIVTGRLCTPIDTFGEVEIPAAEEGDLIAVFNVGAYGYSASPLLFLSHDPPAQVMIMNNENIL